MNELTSTIEVLKQFLNNPWLLSFGGLWVLGYMLKEHSPVNNRLIPWVIEIVGGILGVVLIEKSLGGAIIGFLMGYVIIGSYEHYKSGKELFKI
jgi:hypothetical protein